MTREGGKGGRDWREGLEGEGDKEMKGGGSGERERERGIKGRKGGGIGGRERGEGKQEEGKEACLLPIPSQNFFIVNLMPQTYTCLENSQI